LSAGALFFTALAFATCEAEVQEVTVVASVVIVDVTGGTVIVSAVDVATVTAANVWMTVVIVAVVGRVAVATLTEVTVLV
jgi:hypothetical protein